MAKRYEMTSSAAARRLGVSHETVNRWCRLGKVDALKNVSGYWRLNRDDVDEIQVEVVTER
jgi:excisionase family DNA binding protein